jgi:cytoskeletal protein RodZ
MSDNLSRVEPEEVALSSSTKLQEIGSNLRQIRQEQTLSIEEIAERTRIQPRLLYALEEGRSEVLPEPVYIQSMIKKYGDVLGVDCLELAKSVPPSQSQIVPFQQRRGRSLPGGPQVRPIHLYGAYILLLIGSISALSHSLHSSSHPPTALSRAGDSLPAATNSALVEPVASNHQSPVELEISAKSTSWVKVVVDGKKAFEGNLSAGKAQTWVAQRELVLTTANAGGLVVTQNNQQPIELGAPGQKRQVKFQAKAAS